MTETMTPATASTRILVIDDDPNTVRLVKTWLDGRPFEVLAAGDGESGMREAIHALPDLVLLDLRLPDMDGIHVARQLRKDPRTAAVPIILLTACRDTETKVEAFAAGADDYVTKPFEFEEMEARVRSVLRRRDMLRGLQSQVQDLTSANSRLENLLMLDEKTGLYNFREFQRRLTDEWSRASRYGTLLSLVFLDLDRFKQVNDTLGHLAGDRVLREFATLVAGGARANDVAARYGGEEFAIILPHTDGVMARRVAERIGAAVREFVFLADERPTRITVSAGVATYPSTAEITSVDALIRAADRALYSAKSRGRDCVVADSPEAPSVQA